MSLLNLANEDTALVLTTPKRIELLKDGPPASQSNRCQVLGRGAFGTVFKAIYRENPVALKIIKTAAIATLHNEAHVLNWKHKNIVRLIKLESTPAFGLLIMERPSGLCLQRVVDTIALPLLHRVLITLDILSALRFCHYRNVLHLDVKPPNVLVALGTMPVGRGKLGFYRRNYICKLCDFGCSVLIGDSCAQQRNGKGTLRYMSPEALCSASLSSASDIYSLGISMWQLQARRLPFDTLTCNESIAYQVVKHNLRPDNHALIEPLQLGTARPPLTSCYCTERGQSLRQKSVNLLYSYMNKLNPQLDVVIPNDLYKKTNLLARRNLNFEAMHGRVQKHQKRRKEPRLALYFDNLSAVVDTSLEGFYSELYKSCWLSQPELRLSTLQLQKRLQLILAKCQAY